jgi:hypothetical protein
MRRAKREKVKRGIAKPLDSDPTVRTILIVDGGTEVLEARNFILDGSRLFSCNSLEWSQPADSRPTKQAGVDCARVPDIPRFP